jgi:hypothetical protein
MKGGWPFAREDVSRLPAAGARSSETNPFRWMDGCTYIHSRALATSRRRTGPVLCSSRGIVSPLNRTVPPPDGPPCSQLSQQSCTDGRALIAGHEPPANPLPEGRGARALLLAIPPASEDAPGRAPLVRD